MNLAFVLVMVGTILAGVSIATDGRLLPLLPPAVVLIGIGVLAGVGA